MPPRYQQIATSLAGQIGKGKYSVGARLPTEFELSDSYNASRGTVRRALDLLEEHGLISRSPRLGTIVESTSAIGRYQPVAQSAIDIVELASTTRLKKPRTFEILANHEMAARVGVDAGTRWSVLEGARMLSSKPTRALCWSEHYTALALEHTGTQLTTRDWSRRLAAQEVSRLEIEQTVSADLLTADMAKQLDAVAHSPALVIRRRHFDANGTLKAVGIHTHPSDRYSLVNVIHAIP